MRKAFPYLAGIAALGLLAGCQKGASDDSASSAPAPRTVPAPVFAPNVDAGVPVTQSADPKEIQTLVAAVSPRLGSRRDPFALSVAERNFDRQMMSERFYSESGGSFPSLFEVKDEAVVTAPPIVEAQPYRRLSGIVIGDSVLALLEMGGGEVVLIRPGMMVPNTEWKVISIDETKAVLRRAGNRLPREITVKLEAAQAGTQGFGNPGNAPGGLGGPGMPPGFGGPGGPSGFGGGGGRIGGGRAIGDD